MRGRARGSVHETGGQLVFQAVGGNDRESDQVGGSRHEQTGLRRNEEDQVQACKAVAHSGKSRPPRERVYRHRRCIGVVSEANTVDEVVGVVVVVVETEMRDESGGKGEVLLKGYNPHQHLVGGVVKAALRDGHRVERGLVLAARDVNR